MKKITLIVIVIAAVTAFGFVSANNSKLSNTKDTAEISPIQGIEKSGYTETNQDSW